MKRKDAVDIRKKIELAASTMADEDALTSIELFPIWQESLLYHIGTRVRYIDRLYKCNLEHTSQSDWTPDKTASLWSEVSIEEWAEWKQPTGAHDAYHIGDKCSYNGQHWTCITDNNVYAPGVYGWKEA